MRILGDFLEKVRQDQLLVLYAQVRQGGEVVDSWQRFGSLQDTGLTSFSGMMRMESYSTAKTFSGFGVGIAIDEGLITLNDRIADSFPEYTYNITNPYALDVTVEDMLKMSVGLSQAMLFRDSGERAKEKDWMAYVYREGEFVHKPGERFLYNNANTYFLGRLVGRKSGKNLLEYMRYRLFEPLGIGNPDMTTCPLGQTVGANGMAINVDEMGRFGEMILHNGMYQGKRIVSEDFVRAATSPQIATEQKIYAGDENAHFDYGYHIWIDSVNRCSVVMGILGQLCVICPERDAVITVQALDERDRLIGQRVWEEILFRL